MNFGILNFIVFFIDHKTRMNWAESLIKTDDKQQINTFSGSLFMVYVNVVLFAGQLMSQSGV